MKTNSEEERTVIGKGTRVPLYVLHGAVVAAVLLSAKAALLLASIDARLGRIEDRERGCWLVDDQVIWARDLAEMNPGVKVPKPDREGRK